MSTPNFKTMENFPLFVLDTDSVDEDGCEVMDWWEVEMLCRKLQTVLDDFNYDFLFHKISLESGYYSGLQFYVEELNDPNELDNEDCRYEYDLCRSVAIRRYNSEINKVNRALRKLATENGFEEYYCAAIFSNGEAIYYPVQNTVRSRLLQAVSPVTVPVCG